MNINVSIIDQFVNGLQNQIREQAIKELGERITQVQRLKSLAFLFLCVQTWFGFETHDEVFDCLTEGGGDFGVDAIHIAEPSDGEFNITIFQTKYRDNLDGEANFEGNGIEKLIQAVRILFDVSHKLQGQGINRRLEAKVEEVRSLIQDRYIPRVTVIACNNGKQWNEASQSLINNSNFGNQVGWQHFNHDKLLDLLQSKQPVKEKLQLSGKSFIDDVNYFRVIIGRIQVSEVARLMKTHGEKLLDRNIRRYLGLSGNRVNENIKNTLLSENAGNFYFYNNGLTLVCTKFSRDDLQSGVTNVKIEDLQIVNGGQTSMTILKVSEELEKENKTLPETATVLVRIYEIDKEKDDVSFDITYATNNQNPVVLKELKSNDEIQKKLEISIKELGYDYVRKSSTKTVQQNDITIGVAAEAILSVWRMLPHKAKFRTSEHFGSLYKEIFSKDLNGSQVIIAALIYKIAERHRRQVEVEPIFIRYASCFIAMQMGRALLREMGIKAEELNHRNFEQARKLVEDKGQNYFAQAVKEIEAALEKFYEQGYKRLTLQQLSASFRREGLVQILQTQKSDRADTAQ